MSQAGYAGRFLRVDLSQGQISEETFDQDTLRRYLGGTGLGAKLLYEEVPPGIGWSVPQNRLVLASGPLGGTQVGGSGTYSVVTKGALTNGATATQANGLFGAYLKFSGFDGVVLQGAAPDWQYLHIHEGKAELRDARHLLGRNTWETEEAIKGELGYTQRGLSVVGIGPAGENRVRFAAICGDRGHVAGHNGPGAVMGSKRLKAIAAARKGNVRVWDRALLTETTSRLLEDFQHKAPAGLNVFEWGTLQGLVRAASSGWLPIKNYQTNVWDVAPEKLSRFSAEYIRSHFQPRRNPCWACQARHCHILKVTEGPYKGEVVEEPEYEGFAACGPVIGNTDVAAAMVLASDVDKLGLEINESGWLLGFTMECYQKGLITREDLGGLEMTWGNVEACRSLLRHIAHRQGLGDILAEGTMRAAERIGAEARNLAIHTRKGNTPRGHDHRVVWLELFDTAVSNSGTIETSRIMPLQVLGLTPPSNPFSPEEVSALVAGTKGSMQFEDSLGVCRFNTRTDLPLLCQALHAATGWDFDVEEAMEMGRRAVNIMRLFNLRHGVSPELDAPSPRYASAPADGPAKGRSILPAWHQMLQNYYRLMGWDEAGSPTEETLKRLGLGHFIPDLPGRAT